MQETIEKGGNTGSVGKDLVPFFEGTIGSYDQGLAFVAAVDDFIEMVDYEWTWPTKIERDIIERALTLDFLPEARNLVLVGRNGLGKTMIAKNICHAAVFAGSSVRFRSAPALLEELQRQTPEGRRHKLRIYANVDLLCIDEVGYLSFDDKAADLLEPAPSLGCWVVRVWNDSGGTARSFPPPAHF